uniref:At1g61320/AtMIF1 LRR domain-containing protein n=1 Tax=Oryza meridionalis TaxID=40149 RepID=A0A0E0CR01_9ORYZ
MAVEAGSAREARAAELEAGLAREARPMEGDRIGARDYDKCLSMDNVILTEAHEARCAVAEYGKCISMDKDVIMDAHKSLLAIRTYVEGKVPPTVKLNVVEPCSRCHAIEL